MNVRSYVRTDFDSMFEIKVLEYPKIILDCQSFFNQLVVYKGSGKDIFHLTAEECYQTHLFLYESQLNKESTCLSLNKDSKQVELSNKPPIDCK
jgi:hypothetical protein